MVEREHRSDLRNFVGNAVHWLNWQASTEIPMRMQIPFAKEGAIMRDGQEVKRGKVVSYGGFLVRGKKFLFFPQGEKVVLKRDGTFTFPNSGDTIEIRPPK